MKKLNQKGFSVVEAMLLVVIVGLLAGVGWYVYNQQKDVNKSLDNAQGNLQELAQQNNGGSEPVNNKSETDSIEYVSKTTGVSFRYPSTLNKISSGSELGSEDSLVLETADFKEAPGEYHRPSIATSGAKIIYTAQSTGATDSPAKKTTDKKNYIVSITVVQEGIEHQFRIDTSSKAAFNEASAAVEMMSSTLK